MCKIPASFDAVTSEMKIVREAGGEAGARRRLVYVGGRKGEEGEERWRKRQFKGGRSKGKCMEKGREERRIERRHDNKKT